MKLIKLELQTLPSSYTPRQYVVAKYPKIKPVLISQLETIDYMDSLEVTQDIYDLQALCLGKYHQEFFIRKKDMAAMENFLHGFINKATSDLLEELSNTKPKMLPDLIAELKRKLDQEIED